jgi:hypothetical protein
MTKTRPRAQRSRASAAPMALRALGLRSGLTHMEWFRHPRRHGRRLRARGAAARRPDNLDALLRLRLRPVRAWARPIDARQFYASGAPLVGRDGVAARLGNGAASGRCMASVSCPCRPLGYMRADQFWAPGTELRFSACPGPEYSHLQAHAHPSGARGENERRSRWCWVYWCSKVLRVRAFHTAFTLPSLLKYTNTSLPAAFHSCIGSAHRAKRPHHG